MLRFRLAPAALIGLVALAFAAQASAAPYTTPGYKGVKRFGKAVPVPLPTIPIGTGKYPNLLVDESGTAHIVFAQDGGLVTPDLLSFCNLQRGIKTCASSGNAPNPAAPASSEGGDFLGNFP